MTTRTHHASLLLGLMLGFVVCCQCHSAVLMVTTNGVITAPTGFVAQTFFPGSNVVFEFTNGGKQVYLHAPAVATTADLTTATNSVTTNLSAEIGARTNGLAPTTNATFHEAMTVQGTVQATNFLLSVPRWVDEKFSGLGFGVGGTVPARTVLYGGIYGRAFDTSDDADWSMQWQHGLATTNADFPNLYYQPHVHVSVAAIGAGESNATFVLEYQVTAPNAPYSNAAPHYLLLTNTLTMTLTNHHYLLSWGLQTNNALSGRDSVVTRGSLRRIASASGTIAARVFVDSLDFHIPVREYGSIDPGGDAP